MHADKSIYRRNGIYLIYLQKFPTIEIGLRARCQILNSVRRDQTHWIGKCHALVVGCIAQKLEISLSLLAADSSSSSPNVVVGLL